MKPDHNTIHLCVDVAFLKEIIYQLSFTHFERKNWWNYIGNIPIYCFLKFDVKRNKEAMTSLSSQLPSPLYFEVYKYTFPSKYTSQSKWPLE